MTEASDIFLSYKAEDRGRLQPLVAGLEAEGFTVWWDARIGAGSHWRQDIQQHLDVAKCVIVAWSKRSIGPKGNFVHDEASRAQRRGAYLPIRLDRVEPPLGFGEVQAISLQGWKGNRADPRYLALVEAVRKLIAGEDISHLFEHLADPTLSRRALVAGGGVAITAAATGAWLLFKPAPANSRRIAVLPFANLSNDPEQTYFSEGIAEEIRGALSRIGLEVIGRSSSDAVKDLDTKAIAAKLRVANVLTGSVRRSPRMIRISAQLVSGSDGVERWAQSYDRAPGDAITIQTDIAFRVAQALSIALGQAARAALTLGGTTDGMAQELLLQSRKLIRESNAEEALRRAIALADAALARDPSYADAYVSKALATVQVTSAYSRGPAETGSGFALAAAAARQALRIAPDLGSAHAVQAYIEGSRLNFGSSLRYIRQALARSPEEAEVLMQVSRLVVFIGDGQEALQLSNRCLSLDPLNPRAYRIMAEILKTLRQYPQAIEAGRRAIELAPEGHAVRFSIGNSLLLLDRYAEAKAEYQLMPPDDLFRLTGEAMVAARTHDIDRAQRITARIKDLFGAAASYQNAEIYVQLGNNDRAFAELDNAVAGRDPGLMYFKTDAFLDPIRADPRFTALLTRLKFPG